ncbi:MAG TPA: hypothetical protein VFR95_08580 [Gemmatimonadaceae bacterium]|nr:hypothetical protein [Gemmatimonadaceae bacterium]
MEQIRHVSGDADARREKLREGTPTRPDSERPGGDRPAAPRAREVEMEKPSEPDDIVLEASDDSFPASDPPAWIAVWL